MSAALPENIKCQFTIGISPYSLKHGVLVDSWSSQVLGGNTPGVVKNSFPETPTAKGWDWFPLLVAVCLSHCIIWLCTSDLGYGPDLAHDCLNLSPLPGSWLRRSDHFALKQTQLQFCRGLPSTQYAWVGAGFASPSPPEASNFIPTVTSPGCAAHSILF